MGRGLLAFVALAAIAAVLLAGTPHAAGASQVAGALSGPDALAPGGQGAFFLNASGGPAADANGNYSIRFWITGSDLTGGLPLPASPQTQQTNVTGHFRFNVTAPRKEQAITVVVEINSTAGRVTEKGTVTRAVTVIAPIVFSATFRNPGGAAALNVPVKFYVDGKFVGATNLSRVDPNGTGTATFSYLPAGLAPGSHTVRVEADLNRNGIIEPDKGEVSVTDVFYKKDFELTWPWAGLAIVVIVFFSALIVRARRRRR